MKVKVHHSWPIIKREVLFIIMQREVAAILVFQFLFSRPIVTLEKRYEVENLSDTSTYLLRFKFSLSKTSQKHFKSRDLGNLE